MKALIVDDSRTACRVLARLLARHHIEADSVPSAEEALERLRHHKPDVIFMDHAMPGMDGLETVRLLKSNPDTAVIPVVMYTSREGEVYVGQARALGAVDVLSKDSLEDSLENTVQRLRQLHRRRQPEADAVAPAQAPAAREDWSREAQAELTRQMYLILTEQQISQKNQTTSISRGLDRALTERLDGLATRLEAATDLRTEAMEVRLRAGERRLLALSGAFAAFLVVAVALAASWAMSRPAAPDLAATAALENAVADLESMSAALRAGLAGPSPVPASAGPVQASGIPAVGADGATLGWIVGRGEQGSHYDAVSRAGFLFGVSAEGAIGWPMPMRYFSSPGCNGAAMVRDLPGVIFRGRGMRLWYTDPADDGEILRPASELSPAGECRQIDSGPMELRLLLRNDPAVTGVGSASEPVRVSAR